MLPRPEVAASPRGPVLALASDVMDEFDEFDVLPAWPPATCPDPARQERMTGVHFAMAGTGMLTCTAGRSLLTGADAAY